MLLPTALVAAVLLAADPTAPPKPTAPSPAPAGTLVAGDLGAKIDRWLASADFRGSVLVAHRGEVLIRKGYGLADRENGVPYGPDTVFSIGSITKQFTAAAILKLETQGKLSVEDSISKYLSGVPEDKRAITLHQLLTHTSGLESDFAGDYDAVGRDEYVKRILGSKLRSKPGEAFFYANSGYSLLGAIVEIVSGKGYEEFLRENLFLPAGMRDTGYKLPKWATERIAVGYRDGKRWGRITEKPWAADGPYWALRANGGIESTLDDMLRWHAALQGEAVLSAAVKEKMYARYVREGAGADSFYGYGWSLVDTPYGGRLVEHNGGNGVFYADFLRFVDEDFVVILSTNDSTVRGARISHDVARLAHGEDAAPPPRADAELKPLGTTGRDAMIRAWFDAFNGTDFAAMRAFRAAHAVPHPEVSDAERERRFQRMRDEIGRLDPKGILEDRGDQVAVRAKGSKGPVALLEFRFAADGKLDGIGVELGD